MHVYKCQGSCEGKSHHLGTCQDQECELHGMDLTPVHQCDSCQELSDEDGQIHACEMCEEEA